MELIHVIKVIATCKKKIRLICLSGADWQSWKNLHVGKNTFRDIPSVDWIHVRWTCLPNLRRASLSGWAYYNLK